MVNDRLADHGAEPRHPIGQPFRDMAAMQWQIAASGLASHQPDQTEVRGSDRDRVVFIAINMASRLPLRNARGGPAGVTAITAMGRSMSFLHSRQQVAPQGIGKPGRRREDARFLTGAGKYADDMSLPGQAYAYVVRSPHAHARIVSIDVGPAAGGPGVFAVLTGTDAAADGLQPIPQRPVPANPYEVPLKSRDGSPFLIAPHPVLALGKTRYVGEPVAVVVAETL
jgi:hypothetical protein